MNLIGRRASQLAESTRAAQFEWRVLCARLAARRDLGGGSAAADGAGIDRLVADELLKKKKPTRQGGKIKRTTALVPFFLSTRHLWSVCRSVCAGRSDESKKKRKRKRVSFAPQESLVTEVYAGHMMMLERAPPH